MAREAHFRVRGSFDSASHMQEATVTIDRDTGAFSVRVLRRRKKWESTLSVIAQTFVKQMILLEVQEKKARKKTRRSR